MGPRPVLEHTRAGGPCYEELSTMSAMALPALVALPLPPLPSCTILLMNRYLARRSVCVILLTMVSPKLSADDSVDFNHDIRPLLSSNCLTCHGPDEEERAADLRFDTEQGSRQDFGGYAAIVPGDPDESELVERLTTDDEDLRMPPEGKGRRLTTDEVESGSPLDSSKAAATPRHWSYETPTRPPLALGQATRIGRGIRSIISFSADSRPRGCNLPPRPIA